MPAPMNRVLSIAVVDDSPSDRQRLIALVRAYEADSALTLRIVEFEDGAALVENYQPDYDVILLDIQMGGIDGMRAAAAIREVDTSVIIIFATKTAQYAVTGYSVQALSYLLKPVTPFALANELNRSLALLQRRERESVLVGSRSAPRRIDLAEIIYIESRRHLLLVHSASGTVTFHATLKEYEDLLGDRNFYRSNSSYLLNLMHVVAIDGDDSVMSNGQSLKISRSRKKGLLEALTDYIGGRLV
ncbi:LytTR family DNA-binding domain-containing protein [Microbacterium sp.]|uniref:LytR/AlgR family response regulator transcription factor n=1 Tax=Microbacterium sp. TaxID=51671 RepID=UPI002811C1DA|nr:LytTR family DNA-binding domain-containing protein [Microbacterium sp.]